jgi:glycosyltransferase involved in cell wall biosynthesis
LKNNPDAFSSIKQLDAYNLNVLMIAQYFPPDIGGSATHAYNLAAGLDLNDCNVTVIAAYPHYPHGKIPAEYQGKPLKMEYMGKIKVIRTFMPPIKTEGFIKRLMLMASFAVSSLFAFPWVGKVDAIWASSWTPGHIYSKLKRVPVVRNVDDLTLEDLVDLKLIDENSLVLKIATIIYRTFYLKGDVVTPISKGYSETIAKKYYVNPDKIVEVRIGVNIKKIKKSKCHPNTGTFKVIYAGILGIGYDFDQILKCAQILERDHANVEFLLHGTGECLAQIKKGIKEMQLTSVALSTTLLPSREDVANLMGSADALILPMRDYGHRYLGLPTKLYEYQAVGKPIICCCEGVPSDYISETESGVIVKPGDYDALAKTILRLKNDSAFACSLGENGRKHVETEESIEAIGFKMKKQLERICSK